MPTTDPLLPQGLLDELAGFDTPTICNALEVVVPERRGHGYTLKPFFCPRPELKPIVGYARTATIRGSTPPPGFGTAEVAAAAAEQRVAYYGYIGSAPGPSVTVIEDLDSPAGHGAWWGEVNTNLHQGLGSLGAITNGSIRDIDDSAPGFALLAGMAGPSHAWVRVVDFGIDVTVHGMTVGSGDLVHADRHGAVVIPIEAAAELPAAAEAIAEREARLIEASQRPGFTAATIAELLGVAAPTLDE